MCISLKIHMMKSINWKKTQFTLSSTGASPGDLRYAVKKLASCLSKVEKDVKINSINYFYQVYVDTFFWV
jgi:ribonuclease HII